MRAFLDTKATPLGKLIIEKSYSSKTRQVKATKTDNPREMSVHPTLAKVLAEGKLHGFERFVGRKPRPEDLIVPALPSLADKKSGSVHSRNANHMLRRFHEDLERVGLRARRQHDASTMPARRSSRSPVRTVREPTSSGGRRTVLAEASSTTTRPCLGRAL